jgi:hypothetical protein
MLRILEVDTVEVEHCILCDITVYCGIIIQ